MLKILLNLNGIVGGGQFQAIGDSFHMRINDDGRLVKGLAEQHVGRFPTDARQCDQIFHAVRHMPAELCTDRAGAGHEIFRFAFEKTGRPDDLFEFGQLGVGQFRRGRIAFEQDRSDQIHALVRALGRQNGCHEQLPG